MAINYFIGWTRAELERELRSAQEDLAAGKSTTQAGSADGSMQARIEKSCEERIRMILRALNLIAPDDYPSSSFARATKAKIVFNNPNGISYT